MGEKETFWGKENERKRIKWRREGEQTIALFGNLEFAERREGKDGWEGDGEMEDKQTFGKYPEEEKRREENGGDMRGR